MSFFSHARSLPLSFLIAAVGFSFAANAGAQTSDAATASAAPATAAPAAETTAAAPAAWSPSQPLTIAHSSGSYVNIALIGDAVAGGTSKRDTSAIQTGGHDPLQRGFSIQGVELVFDGAVDNYFRASANIVGGLDSDGNSFFELEEAYAETLGLPGGLQFRAGQYLTEFGRVNTQHPHSWDYVDSPLVAARFLGPDGLRNPGARLSWLAPTPFYSELFFGVQNSNGETAHSFRNGGGEGGHDHAHGGGESLPFGRPGIETSVRGVKDMLYSARYAFSFELSDTQTLLAGISGAWGPNATGERTRTDLYGVDVFWKWKPTDHNKGFPFVSLQAEAMFRRYEAGAATGIVESIDPITGDDVDTEVALRRETLWDWGAYAQVSYGFREGWVASLRADYVEPLRRGEYEAALDSPDTSRERRWRISPALTWYPSEFSRVRLQYNLDHGKSFGTSHGVWLQIEFLLGAHGAHKF